MPRAVLLAAAVLGVLRGPGVRGVRDSIRRVDASEVGARPKARDMVLA